MNQTTFSFKHLSIYCLFGYNNHENKNVVIATMPLIGLFNDSGINSKTTKNGVTDNIIINKNTIFRYLFSFVI
jgi:hypothetical protein